MHRKWVPIDRGQHYCYDSRFGYGTHSVGIRSLSRRAPTCLRRTKYPCSDVLYEEINDDIVNRPDAEAVSLALSVFNSIVRFEKVFSSNTFSDGVQDEMTIKVYTEVQFV